MTQRSDYCGCIVHRNHNGTIEVLVVQYEKPGVPPDYVLPGTVLDSDHVGKPHEQAFAELALKADIKDESASFVLDYESPIIITMPTSICEFYSGTTVDHAYEPPSRPYSKIRGHRRRVLWMDVSRVIKELTGHHQKALERFSKDPVD